MHPFYLGATIILTIIAFAVGLFNRPKQLPGSEVIPKDYYPLQLRYLAAWFLCALSDWLQGPYVYALYDSYGFSRNDIAKLFVAGFGSSMVFGFVVGIVSDRFGRRMCCVAYCVIYIISCCTKHFNDYYILMAGRITGGIATSILFSCFESWVVYESSTRHRFNSILLRQTFAWMYWGNSIMAILAGFSSEAVVTWGPKLTQVGAGPLHYGGFTLPFDMSIVSLLIGMLVIVFSWRENTAHDEEHETTVMENINLAVKTLFYNRRVWILGCCVACFEGAMYIFVFNWTPAMTAMEGEQPFGLIFALFMMACMIGASLFNYVQQSVAATRIAAAVIFAAVFTMMLPMRYCTFLQVISLGSYEVKPWMIIFASFLMFELACGAYFPSVGTLKSDIVPEESRSTIYNLYRVPLNAIVAGVLLGPSMDLRNSYGLCAALLLASSGAAFGLVNDGKIKFDEEAGEKQRLIA